MSERMLQRGQSQAPFRVPSDRTRGSGHKPSAGLPLWTSGNTFLLWGWPSTGMGCPEVLWSFHLCSCSEAVWARPEQQALDGCNWAGGLKVTSRGAPHPQQFCDSVITILTCFMGTYYKRNQIWALPEYDRIFIAIFASAVTGQCWPLCSNIAKGGVYSRSCCFEISLIYLLTVIAIAKVLKKLFHAFNFFYVSLFMQEVKTVPLNPKSWASF